MFLWNESLSAELDCSLLKGQSLKRIKTYYIKATNCVMTDTNCCSQEVTSFNLNSVLNCSKFCCPYPARKGVKGNFHFAINAMCWEMTSVLIKSMDKKGDGLL